MSFSRWITMIAIAIAPALGGCSGSKKEVATSDTAESSENSGNRPSRNAQPNRNTANPNGPNQNSPNPNDSSGRIGESEMAKQFGNRPNAGSNSPNPNQSQNNNFGSNPNGSGNRPSNQPGNNNSNRGNSSRPEMKNQPGNNFANRNPENSSNSAGTNRDRPKGGSSNVAPKKKLSKATPTGKTGTNPGDKLPQITGKDFDGRSFKLSDYQGKVIMIDFWGDW